VDSENRFLLGICTILVITLIAIISIVCYSAYKQSQLFVEGKYVSCVLHGTRGVNWCR